MPLTSCTSCNKTTITILSYFIVSVSHAAENPPKHFIGRPNGRKKFGWGLPRPLWSNAWFARVIVWKRNSASLNSQLSRAVAGARNVCENTYSSCRRVYAVRHLCLQSELLKQWDWISVIYRSLRQHYQHQPTALVGRYAAWWMNALTLTHSISALSLFCLWID